jgi:hypothetical protein
MATKKTTAAEDPSTTTEAAPAPVTFRDTVFTSRVLILPDSMRELPVRAHLVSVVEDDAEAMAFLQAHSDLVREG